MKYIRLLKDFVNNKISSDEFESQFLEIFQNEKLFDSEREFQILDKLFGDVDAYCGDSDLFDSEFDIDEAELRLSVQQALNALEEEFAKTDM
ncbi:MULTISPECIES: colicin immunity domain-containing protein [unclassified Microcoleus]|uniref:colicin immunity domain-containing protein n=1 Tax=unclassified Microcoleus TaxID=2642155 RepID=UPI0025CBC5E3|nr:MULTISPECIES: colicin immunity domain-containing protein [unclassified Microcoleus]